jgi:hypothetical protein
MPQGLHAGKNKLVMKSITKINERNADLRYSNFELDGEWRALNTLKL